MINLDKNWVDKKLDLLFLKLKDSIINTNEFFLEPDEGIYQRLESGDENDLKYVVEEIRKHIGVPLAPVVRYEWGLKMEPEIAGRIKSASQMPLIQIPFFYVGKKYAVGGILAHEMTHALLYQKGVSLDDPDENEAFTDLSASLCWFGEIVAQWVCG